MASEAADGRHDPYLANLNITTSKHLNLCNKLISGLPENNCYDLTRFDCKILYQQSKESV